MIKSQNLIIYFLSVICQVKMASLFPSKKLSYEKSASESLFIKSVNELFSSN